MTTPSKDRIHIIASKVSCTTTWFCMLLTNLYNFKHLNISMLSVVELVVYVQHYNSTVYAMKPMPNPTLTLTFILRCNLPSVRSSYQSRSVRDTYMAMSWK